MDSREPDSNVVRLRRDGDLTDEERQQLARTIFAEQDEVGTFSRGNLVPPRPATPPSSDESPAADPFFDELQSTPQSNHSNAAAAAGERDTAAYFQRLGSQTSAEMSDSVAPQTAAAAMPGSASMPGEAAIRRRRGLDRRRVSWQSAGRPIPIPRIHVGALPLLALLGALLVAGVAVAAIVGGGHGTHAASQLATRKVRPHSSHDVPPAIPPLLITARSHSSFPHRGAPRRPTHMGRRHRHTRKHASAAPAPAAERAASTDSGATTNAAAAVAAQSSTASSASGSQATPTTPSASSSSHATSTASGATQTQHAGPTGPAAILGPGRCNC